MNGKKAIGWASATIIVVLGVLIFVFGLFRDDVAAVELDVKDHAQRLTVVETNYEHIRADQTEMKADIKDIKAAVVGE